MNVSVSPKAAARRADVTAAVVQATQRIRFDDIPARTIATTKRVLLDTLAVAWAAADAAGVNAARALALRGAPGHASLWGEGDTRREPSAAAFYNGTLAAALDFDSLAGFVHADIIVAPAALAVAEQQRRNGRELLAALTLGNELVVRLAAATRTNRGFFHTSIAGVFGAALAAARLRGLDADRTHNALGIALCHAGGTQQSHVEQRLTKRLQSAFAARDGIISADLAALGTTGPRAAFEGPFGLFALFEEGRPEEVLDGLGQRYLIEGTALKRFPACGCSHAALAAALEIVARHGITGADVARGEIVLTPYMARLVGGAFAPEANPQVTGQFNVRYGVAAVLARGGFGLADIEPAAVLDPAIRPLVERLSVRVDESRTGTFAPADVTIETHDGRRLSHRVEAVPGSPEAPLGEDEIHAKLVAAFGYGRNALPPVRIEALVQRIQRLEGVDDVSTLFDQVL
ncbi:MmgE/PrpD family protein [Xanthobacter aminoxidans]|uniref:MmgE/PrpD family protein n=1 Tax=Xanthobacter aminoxidans TaxID=186280 RepID=UPI0020231431|nr:MmgE/PrpD family protein [Xanthobacter aminoxidans]MCL8384792.1 MmgE/PrpD family protein [Xanthobacter aminoxidans]